MIICTNFCGQLGNHILTMNNLIQLSELLKVPYQNNSNIIQKYFDVKYNKYKDRDNFTSYSTLLNSRQLVKIFDNEPKFILDNLLTFS